ncbi:hypothetical protein [Streptomyces sp. NPDC023588]|uniref:hypothetical protein n=1 Tax=Streptomyces sp. NPDC023588 TaxID=3154907 RepID=UPI0034089814
MVGWGQLRLSPAGRRRRIGPPGRARSEGEHILLGPGRFDRTTGALVAIGGLALRGPRLNLWRAPTDNDRGWSQRDAAYWKDRGLDRRRRRTVSVTPDAQGMTSSSAAPPPRAAAATSPPTAGTATATACACGSTPNPSATGPSATTPSTTPWSTRRSRRRNTRSCSAGTGPAPWPHRTGLGGSRRLVPGGVVRRGSGRGLPHSWQAVRVGRFRAAVDELQTPYVRSTPHGTTAISSRAR